MSVGQLLASENFLINRSIKIPLAGSVKNNALDVIDSYGRGWTIFMFRVFVSKLHRLTSRRTVAFTYSLP